MRTVRVAAAALLAAVLSVGGCLALRGAATGRVDSFVVRAQDNSTNHFVLTGVKTNQNFDAKDFKYKVPKGYVETRE